MTKTQELKKEFLALQAELQAMVDAQQDVPQELQTKLEQLKDDYNIQKAAENAAKNKLQNNMEGKNMDKKLFNKAFKALLKGKTQEYFDTVGTYGQVESVDGRGGYLIDTEMLPLDEYGAEIVTIPARVIPVWSPKGNIPNIDMSQAIGGNFFSSFDEIDSMTQTHAVFSNVSYQCTERGAICPVSMRLLNDAQADVVGVIGRVFGVAAAADRNAKILAALNAISNPKSETISAANGFADIEAIDDIMTAIRKDLKGINRSKAKIVVCDTSFAKLASIKNSDNEYSLKPMAYDPSRYQIEGVEVIAIDDAFMTASNTLTEVAWIGNFERIAVIERQGLEISTDASNMFDKDAIAVKGKVYNCVKVLEDGAFVKIS